jgi:predicted pyridoxine 5'-phosphate oxidase superfamily flavin-nucleotide-binding protein
MKMITASIHELLTQATAKALATYHNGEVNVVPVSSIKIVDDTIRLVDYFMQKTAINIKHNPYVSLVARKEMIGYQIKGEALYVESGRHFDDACAWVARMHPDRKVK